MLWWKRVIMLVRLNTKTGDYSHTNGHPDRTQNPDQSRLVRWSGYYDSDFLVRSVVRIFSKNTRSNSGKKIPDEIFVRWKQLQDQYLRRSVSAWGVNYSNLSRLLPPETFLRWGELGVYQASLFHLVSIIFSKVLYILVICGLSNRTLSPIC